MSDIRLKGIAVILFGILLSASSAEMNRTVSVSYTHLDVYKRQAICRWMVRLGENLI